jgi:hypothetical protein
MSNDLKNNHRNKKTMKTVNLKGKPYVPVVERINQFHEIYTNGEIVTEYEFREGFVIFKATVTPDIKNSLRTFTGHSFGKIGQEKAFEKLESVAVGRALAFAGFAPDGSIATAEEMENFYQQNEDNNDISL